MRTFKKSLFLMGLCLAGCGDKKPPAAAVTAEVVRPDGPVTVVKGADLTGVRGLSGAVIGQLKRIDPDGGTTGTAIVLTDGTAVYVSAGEPPAGWDWMIEETIRVEGTIWDKVPGDTFGSWTVAGLLKPGAPMPGEVGMGSMAF